MNGARWRVAVALGLVFACGLAAAMARVTTVSGAAPSIAVATASTAMTSTLNFSNVNATASCPSGSTLVSGGDELTRSGAPVPNDGAVTLGLYPSDGSGSPSGSGTANPSSWNTAAGYSGMAPGTDTATSFAICATGIATGTTVVTAMSGPNSLGPVTAACPGGTSLVGGGGGYTAFIAGTNAKVFDSFPSDGAGNAAGAGSTNPTAWTLQGNSNSVTGETTMAVALCATGPAVATVVAKGSNSAAPVTGGSTVTATATCPDGTVLLAGGSNLSDNPSGPGTGGQGVHLIGNYPSDGGGNPAGSGSPQSWTVIAQDGGQNLNSLGVETFALCAQSSAATTSTGTTSTTTPTGGASTTTPVSTSVASTTTTSSSTAATAKSAKVTAGHAGALVVGSGSQSVTLAWPKAALGKPPLTLTATPATPIIQHSKGQLATTSAVDVVVKTAAGKAVTHFSSALELTFSGAAGNVTPAYSHNGVTWSEIPLIPAGKPPAGLQDGYFRDKVGSLHILTLHATEFGLLVRSSLLKPTLEPLAFGYQLDRKLGSGKLGLTVEATRPATLTVTLKRGSTKVTSWRKRLSMGTSTVSLALPSGVTSPGGYQLQLAARAGAAYVSRVARLTSVGTVPRSGR